MGSNLQRWSKREIFGKTEEEGWKKEEEKIGQKEDFQVACKKENTPEEEACQESQAQKVRQKEIEWHEEEIGEKTGKKNSQQAS